MLPVPSRPRHPGYQPNLKSPPTAWQRPPFELPPNLKGPGYLHHAQLAPGPGRRYYYSISSAACKPESESESRSNLKPTSSVVQISDSDHDAAGRRRKTVTETLITDKL